MDIRIESRTRLAEEITWRASKQTYFTIRWLVDRGRVPAAYRTYAYFRWVDDTLDADGLARPERLAFVERQHSLMERLYRGERPAGLAPEELMLLDLIESDTEPDSGLQTYIRNMMAVMDFDARRRGRLVSQKELSEYTRWLATAVTEAMHYFIGHNCGAPCGDLRYRAVTAAHVVHMLRDAHEDVAAGYFNIPRETLEAHGITPSDTDSPAYRAWVCGRVELARACFKTGAAYLAQVQNPRCRLAGYAYTARFTRVLDAIERNGYRLQPAYPELHRPWAPLGMAWSALWLAFTNAVSVIGAASKGRARTGAQN